MLSIDSKNEASRVKKALESSKIHVVDYAVKSAEQRLDAQTSIMIASDARSLAMSRIGVSISALSLTIFLSLTETTQITISFLAPIVLLAVLSFIGAYWCYRAARPVDVFPSGWAPVEFMEDGDICDLKFKASVAAYMGERIRRNDTIINQNSEKFQFGVQLIFLGPLLSASMFAVLWFF